MSTTLKLALGLAAAMLFAGTAQAAPSKQVQTHCVHDYKAYCGEWGLETRGLKHCMRKHGDRLNSQCVAALVHSGEVSQTEVDAYKKK
jgi:hypothetical protein